MGVRDKKEGPEAERLAARGGRDQPRVAGKDRSGSKRATISSACSRERSPLFSPSL